MVKLKDSKNNIRKKQKAKSGKKNIKEKSVNFFDYKSNILFKLRKILPAINVLQGFNHKSAEFLNIIVTYRDRNLYKLKSSTPYYYLLAVIFVLLALILEYSLQTYVDVTRTPFLFFLAAVMLSSWFGGFRPGVLATLLSSLTVDYVFFNPNGVITNNVTGQNIRLIIFTLEGLLISWLNHELLSAIFKKKSLAESFEKERDILDVVMENTDTHLAYLDSKFNFIKANSSYIKSSGFKRKDLIGKNHFKLFLDKENEEIFKNAVKTGEAVQFKEKPFKYENQPWKGTTYWDWSLIPVKNIDEKIEGLVLSLVDVTPRKKTEDLLRSMNEILIMHSRVIENSSDLIIVLDREYKYKMVNPIYSKMHNKPINNIIGKKMPEIIGKKIFQDIIKPHLDKAYNGEFVQFECWFDYKKNGEKFIEIKYYPLIQNGVTEYVVVNIHDITERKLAEEATNLLNNKISNILESITDAFFALDNKWRFIYVNSRTEKIFRKKRENLLGVDFWKIFPEFKEKDYSNKFFQAMNQYQQQEFEYYNQSLGIWFNARIYPAKEGLSVYLHDITEFKELDLRKDEFISIASHELKTPLTTIKAYTQLLDKKFKDLKNDEISDYLAKVNDHLNKLKKITDDLLDVSRIRGGRLELNKEDFDIDNFIESAVLDLQKISLKHKIQKEGKLNKKIKADKELIYRVLVNLVLNAIKYSPKKDKVIIHLNEKDNNIVFGVQDFGIGISDEEKDKIFERFYRVNNNKMEENFKGLGLGLYICTQIINKHKGKIWVESEKGKGSTFYFTLPLKG